MVKRCDWDSNFFGILIGEFINGECAGAVEKKFQLLYSKSDFENLTFIDGYHKSYSEIKVVYSKTLKAVNKIDKPIFIKSIYEEVDFDLSDLYALAFESGKFSRFFLDKNFGENNFKKLYQEWINNSLNKKIADDILVYIYNDKIIGFVTYKVSNEIATVGLIAVDEEHQGKGIGKNLLNFAENKLLEQRVVELQIPTQKINEQACSFYQKAGYAPKHKTYIQHFWKK